MCFQRKTLWRWDWNDYCNDCRRKNYCDLQSLYKAEVNADDGSGRIGNLVQLHKKFQALLRKRR